LFLDGEVDIGEGRHVQLIVLLEAFGSMWWDPKTARLIC
jgi:hypothetical protein